MSFDFRQDERMEREHAAWLDLMRELRSRGIEPNDESRNPLIAAMRKWGEELHQLRLGDPSHENALVEVRSAYHGQYEAGTYPKVRR